MIKAADSDANLDAPLKYKAAGNATEYFLRARPVLNSTIC
jgi:hypothetical protein